MYNNELDKKMQHIFEHCREYDPRSKIQPREFTIGLVLGQMSAGERRYLTEILAGVNKAHATAIGKQSFWERLQTQQMTTDLDRALFKAMQIDGLQDYKAQKFADKLNVKSIIILDSMTITLAPTASFQGTAGSKHKAIKLHTLFNLTKQAVEQVELSEAKAHDACFYPDWSKYKDHLFMGDLAYFSGENMNEMQRQGVSFVLRAKENTKYEEIEFDDDPIRPVKRGRPKKYPDIIESRVKLNCCDFYALLIYIFNPQTLSYNSFITNTEIDAKTVGQLYSGRWQIEIFFKALKSNFKIDHISSAKQIIIENMVKCALIAFCLSFSFVDAIDQYSRQLQKTRNNRRGNAESGNKKKAAADDNSTLNKAKKPKPSTITYPIIEHNKNLKLKKKSKKKANRQPRYTDNPDNQKLKINKAKNNKLKTKKQKLRAQRKLNKSRRENSLCRAKNDKKINLTRTIETTILRATNQFALFSGEIYRAIINKQNICETVIAPHFDQLYKNIQPDKYKKDARYLEPLAKAA